jgi:hypothetical protein
MLPLIHLHSLAVLFVVTAFLFVCKPEKWRAWIAFGVGTTLIAVLELLWSTAGSATRTSEFFGWNFGWDKNQDESFFWFWLKNTGIFIPLLLAGIYLVFSKFSARTQVDSGKARKKPVKTGKDRKETIKKNSSPALNEKSLLLFYLPFVFLFFVCNVAKLAPWEWGQYQGFNLLVYCFDSVCRAGPCPALQTKRCRTTNRGGLFGFIDAFRRD